MATQFKKFEFLAEDRGDPSVGIPSVACPVNIEIPQEIWDRMDEDEKADLLDLMRGCAQEIGTGEGGKAATMEEIQEEIEAEQRMAAEWEEDQRVAAEWAKEQNGGE